MRVFCKCTLFWMKYLDLLLANKPGAVDAAADVFHRPASGRGASRRAASRRGTQAAKERVAQYQGLIQSDVRAYR